MFDREKFKELTLYICWRAGGSFPKLGAQRLGATKLNKILWYSDVLSYSELGKPVTDAVYVKRQFGPVPKEIMPIRKELEAEGALVSRQEDFFGKRQTQFFALRKPKLVRFTADEISLIDSIIEWVCDEHSAASISATSHDRIWDAAEIGEELPLFTIFASQAGEVTEDDMAWATDLAEREGLGGAN
ncbi:MAG: SocA family protein [Alphaproteobacteria bacterium]|nr:SocA family protein [Alphaproteobacteria bacterium]